MGLQLTPSKGLKKGTAVRKRGRIQSQKILEVARAIFIAEGYGAFTMRRVAREANIVLSNLQHYYKTKDDLLRAMIEHELIRYDLELKKALDNQNLTAEDRLSFYVDFLLEDLRDPETAHFFFHLWSAAANNEYAAKVMDQAYSHQCKNAYDLIEPLTPNISKRVREQRASIIITMIDGLMLLVAPGKPKHNRLIGIDNEVRKTIRNMLDKP